MGDSGQEYDNPEEAVKHGDVSSLTHDEIRTAITNNPELFNKLDAADAATYCNNEGGCTDTMIGRLDNSKKEAFFRDAQFSNYEPSTLIDNAQYIDGNSDKFINHYNNLPYEKQKALLDNTRKFNIEDTDEFYERITTKRNLDKFWDNYEFGDISNFLGNLNSEHFVSAFKAWWNGPSKITEISQLDNEMVNSALNELGHDVNLDYTEDNEIILEQDTLTVNNNTFNLSQFDGNITANGTVT